MNEINSISNEILKISLGIIGFLLVIGIAIAGLEAQISNLMGIPMHAYKGKILVLILILAIAAAAVPISQGMSTIIH